MTTQTLITAYETFLKTVPFINISNEEDYHEALEAIEQVMELSEDSIDSPYNPLIDILASAIEQYEDQNLELKEFHQQAENVESDIALVRTIMDQYDLTGSDLPEIGDKTMVSKVLNGSRKLNRQAIEKLSARFNISPALFFSSQ